MNIIKKVFIDKSLKELPQIFCFFSGQEGRDKIVQCWANDGTLLYKTTAATKRLGMVHVGITGKIHPIPKEFQEHYPKGFQIIWVDDPIHDKRLGPFMGVLKALAGFRKKMGKVQK